MISKCVRAGVVAAAFAAGMAAPAQAGPIIFSGGGVDAAAIQSAVDSFRATAGDPNNGNTPGSQAGGRREVGWDGGGSAAPATTFPIPMTTFANRGNVYTTPGTGFEISGQPSPEFGDINATYPDIFTTFSAPRLFAPLGSNVMDVFFTQPGTTNVPNFTSAFGVVFTDVDHADTTSLEFFDRFDQSLGVFYAPTFNNGLSFLGVSFGDPKVSKVRIVTGNAALGPNDGGGIDVVAMDDFIYAEPQLEPVPEPGTLSLLGAGLAAAAGRRRLRRKN